MDNKILVKVDCLSGAPYVIFTSHFIWQLPNNKFFFSCAAAAFLGYCCLHDVTTHVFFPSKYANRIAEDAK